MTARKTTRAAGKKAATKSAKTLKPTIGDRRSHPRLKDSVASRSQSRKKIVLVSSTVYGIEELLERIYTLLVELGYEVWMSHKGTVPVSSRNHAFDDCLRAVENCDLFLGIITTSYGSGKLPDKGALSITHQELLKAIELNKPRWLLAHSHVVFARTLLDSLGHKTREDRGKLSFKRTQVLDDLRVIDMYEDATRSDVSLDKRQGNWVQKFGLSRDAETFVQAQFSRYQEAEAFIRESFPPANELGGGRP